MRWKRKYWVLDIGNSRLQAAGIAEGRVLERRSWDTRRFLKSPPRDWSTWLKTRVRGAPVWTASVVPPVDRVLKKTRGGVFRFLDRSFFSDLPIRLLKPEQVGIDRLVNAWEARRRLGAPVLVVDFGTATTVDVVDRRGAYRGGAILPGLFLSARALSEGTAKLSFVQPVRFSRAIGRSTEEAVRSGLFFGTLGAVRELVFRMRKELGAVAPVLATGGAASLFRSEDWFHAVDPDLTLLGIGHLAERKTS